MYQDRYSDENKNKIKKTYITQEKKTGFMFIREHNQKTLI